MWYTKDYKLVKKSDPGRRRSLAPAFVLFYRRCLTTNSIANRMPRLLAMLFVLLGLFCAAARPPHAEDYDTVLDRLSRLQALAREYSANQADTPDPIELTLAYTRTGVVQHHDLAADRRCARRRGLRAASTAVTPSWRRCRI